MRYTRQLNVPCSSSFLGFGGFPWLIVPPMEISVLLVLAAKAESAVRENIRIDIKARPCSTVWPGNTGTLTLLPCGHTHAVLSEYLPKNEDQQDLILRDVSTVS